MLPQTLGFERETWSKWRQMRLADESEDDEDEEEEEDSDEDEYDDRPEGADYAEEGPAAGV